MKYFTVQNLNGDETKMLNAIQAADAFIKTYAANGSYVGIIDFDANAQVNSDLYKLSSDSERSYLSSLLPVESDTKTSGTNIYGGVDAAINVSDIYIYIYR